MGAYALYLKCNQLAVLTSSFSGDDVPRDKSPLFSPVEDSEDIDVFKWQASPKLLIIWFQLQAFPGRKLFLRICAWFPALMMSFTCQDNPVVSETHKVQELIQACVGLSGKNDTGIWFFGLRSPSYFTCSPSGMKLVWKGAHDFVLVSSLLTLVCYCGKPTLWQLCKNRLMAWLTLFLEQTGIHDRPENPKRLRKVGGGSRCNRLCGYHLWRTLRPSCVSPALVCLNHISLLFLPNPPGSFCSSKG